MGNSQSFLATPHHAGLIVCDLEAAMQAYVQDFGYKFFQFEVNQNNSSFTGSSPTFSLRLGIGQLGLNFIEFIQPVSGTTLYSRHLEEKGPGLHHLAFSVTDLAAARKRLAAKGYPCLQDGNIRGLVDFSYYDAPEVACVVEPLQWSSDMLAFLIQNASAYVPKTA